MVPNIGHVMYYTNTIILQMLIEKKMFIYGLNFVQQTLTIMVYILKKSIVHGLCELVKLSIMFRCHKQWIFALEWSSLWGYEDDV
jgi:hypothetical protein